MLTSNGFPIFREAWWADQVISTGLSVTVTFSSHPLPVVGSADQCLPTLGRKGFLLDEEAEPDIGECVWKFWNYLHFLLSEVQLSALFTFVFFN